MEVALAATVLAFTLMGMIGVIESGSQMLDLSRKQTIAGQILHGEIDQIRLTSWSTISGYDPTNSTTTGTGGYGSSTTMTTSTDPLLAMFNTVYPHASSIFTVTRTVTCLQPSQSNPNPSSSYNSPPVLLQVTFTITWTGVRGRSYSRTATTLVAYNGLYQAFQKS
jgi:hypothetical protein